MNLPRFGDIAMVYTPSTPYLGVVSQTGVADPTSVSLLRRVDIPYRSRMHWTSVARPQISFTSSTDDV